MLRHGVHVDRRAEYDIARFGAEFPRFSPRQSDLLWVVGTITQRQGPALRRIYEQMCEPKWVIAFGVCASTGGFYDNYSTVPGIDKIVPVDVYIPGCPPRPEQVLDGLMLLMDRIQRARATARSPSRPRNTTFRWPRFAASAPRAEERVAARRAKTSRTLANMAQIVLDTLSVTSRTATSKDRLGARQRVGAGPPRRRPRSRRSCPNPATSMNMISDFTSVDRFGHEPASTW